MTVCRLVEEIVDLTINVNELKPGQIAVIVSCLKPAHRDLIVKRTAWGGLETLGGKLYWGTNSSIFCDNAFRVRVLKNGTLIRIEENE